MIIVVKNGISEEFLLDMQVKGHLINIIFKAIYKDKIKELRKERDSYLSKANKIAKEMDELVNQINSKNIEWTTGKFVKIDRRDKGGYLTFFHVDTFETRTRGYIFYGKGFNISDFHIHIQDNFTLYVEDGDLDRMTEIKENEFYTAFDTFVNLIKQELNNYQSYKSLGNTLWTKKFTTSKYKELGDEVLNKLKD